MLGYKLTSSCVYGCGVCGCYGLVRVWRWVSGGLWSKLRCRGLHTSTKHEGTADPSKLTPNPNRAPLRAARQTDPSTCLASMCRWEWPRYIIPSATPGETSHCNGPPCSQLYTLHRIPLRARARVHPIPYRPPEGYKRLWYTL